MKKTKLFLGSMVIACAFSACSQVEEIEVANPEATLANRAQVNLVLSSPAETRLQVNANGNVGFTQNDLLGAVMVDGGYSAEGWNKVNWNIIDGHAGNNKWFWDGEKFSTEGTTAVGAWLFYSMYDEAMTSKRAGVEFSFPQIQDGAADLSKAANNNINFHISPIVMIDGQEGDAIDIPVKYSSVYNYFNIKLAFKDADVTSVEKIVVSAFDKKNQRVKFPARSKVVNSAMPVANLSLINKAGNPNLVPNHDGSVDSKKNPTYDYADLAIESQIAYAKLAGIDASYDAKTGKYTYTKNNTTLGTLTEGIGDEYYNYLVVDCGAHSKDLAVVDGKFSTWMLMPAGVYGYIQLDIYTDNGVYTEYVNAVDHWKEYEAKDNNKSYYPTYGYISLYPQTTTSTANINKAEKVPAEYDYLYVDAISTHISEFVTNNFELINLINAIDEKGSYNVNILSQDVVDGGTDEALGAHGIVVNQEVMDAIVAKEAEVKGDIQLVFKGEKVAIVGNASSSDRLDIHDMTFTEGCDVVSGYITTSADIKFDGKIFTVKSGANATFGTNLEVVNKETVADEWNTVVIEKDAKATVIGDIVANEFVNKGTMAVNNTFNLDVDALTNAGILSVKGEVEADVFAAAKGSETTNAGVMTIGDSEIAGAVVNKALINVVGNSVITKDGSILNATADSKVLVNATEYATDLVELVNNGTIVNNGYLYTQNASDSNVKNKIHNLGTIEAKAGSTNYITTNSKSDETQVATNDPEQVMGVVKMDERNARVTVAIAKQQGYKVYEVAATDIEDGILATKKGDAFNKIILSDAAELSMDLVGVALYVETSEDLTLPVDVKNNLSYLIKELTFTESASLVGSSIKLFELNVAQGKVLDIPAGSVIYVLDHSSQFKNYSCKTALSNSKTNVAIYNYGEILLGGKFNTSLSQAAAKQMSTLYDKNGKKVAEGKFSSSSSEAGKAYSWNVF